MYRPSPGGAARPRLNPAVTKPFASPVIGSKAQIPASNRPLNTVPSAPSSSSTSTTHRVPQPPSEDQLQMPPPPQPARPSSQQTAVPPPVRQQEPQTAAPQEVGTRQKDTTSVPPQQQIRQPEPPPPRRREMVPPPAPTAVAVAANPLPAQTRKRFSIMDTSLAPPSGGWRTGSKVGKAFFECGLVLYADRSPDLYVEGSIFRREFTKRLQGTEVHEALPVDNVVTFVEDYISDRGRLLQALLPSKLRHDNKDADDTEDFEAFIVQQQSFIRLLLSIDAIQQIIAERLLEKLVDIADPINETDRNHPATLGIDMPFMIVSQFKWLEHIADPEKMINLFLEAINLDERRGFSRELISALPEIFGDAQHAAIVEKLRPLLNSVQSTYLADVLDTFANLNLETDVVDELRRRIINSLGSMSVDCIPAALKFILSTLTADNSFDVLSLIRDKLDIDDEDFIATFSNEQKQSLFKLIFGELKSALLLNSCQLTNWTKLYTQQPPSGTPEEILLANYEIRPFDFTMLVILHTVSFKKKAIENVLRTRRRLGLVTDKSVQVAFKRYHEVLGDHLRSIVGIADSCVRSPDTTICSFGRLVYTQAFCEFDNVCVRQDIVANLVSHVFSLPISSTNCAMDILLALSEERPELLVCFRVFVRNMLDVLDNLHLSDVRKLYRILANLAFADSVALSAVERTRFKDDLYLIIRKQLAFTGSENGKYRQFGVLAAAMLARGIGQWAQRNPDASFDGTSRQDLASTSSDEMPGSAISTEIKELFNLVQRSISSSDLGHTKDASSLGLFYDELSVLVKSNCLPAETINWLVELLPAAFVKGYLKGEQHKPLVNIAGLHFEANAYSLSGPEEYAEILIFEIAASSIINSASKRSSDISVLCPLFRLLASCCKALTGSVDNDNIIGQLMCPINFPTFRSLSRLFRAQAITLTEQYAICEAVLALCNWFRELISVFGAMEDPFVRGNCLRRLHDLIDASVHLENFSKASPNWVPQFVSSSIFNSNAKTAGRPTKAKAAAKGAKKEKKNPAKKAKTAPPVSGTQAPKSQMPLQSQAAPTQTQAASSGSVTTTFSVMARYRVAFRELSLDTLQLLAGEISKNPGQTDGMEVGPESILQMSASSANSSFSTIFTPCEALYLVEDLIDKLKYKLIKSGSKAFGTFAGGGVSQASEIIHRCLDEKSIDEVLETVCKLAGVLCSLLQGCFVMLTDALNESGGVIDVLQSRAEWVAGLRLYGCIFDCFAMLLVNIPQLRPHLLGSLVFGIANSQVAHTDAADVRTPAGDMVFEAFQWLSNFSSTMPTLLIAGSYLRTLEALLTLCKRGNNRAILATKLHRICEELMKTDWTDSEKTPGTPSYKVISHIFQLYLIHGQPRLSEALGDFIDIINRELMSEGAGPDATSITYRILSRRTFPVFYEVLLTQLIRVAQTAPSLDNEGQVTASQQQQLARSQPVEVGFLSQRHHVIPDGAEFGHREMLDAWDDLCVIFRDAIELTKTFDNRSCLASVIKHGRTFLEIFSKRAMPLLDVAFSSHPSKVKDILGGLQRGTRMLHIICSESKSHREVSIIAQVPRLKKTLEAFLLRVKHMLNVNNCSNVFTVGVLKARNIRGDEISSQNPYKHGSDDEEAEQQPPPTKGKRGKKKATTEQSKSSSQRSEGGGNEDSNETAGGDEEEQDEDETVNDEEAEEDEEAATRNDDDEDDTVAESEEYGDARDTFGSNSRSRNQPSKSRKRHSYSTAFDDDEDPEDVDDDEEEDEDEDEDEEAAEEDAGEEAHDYGEYEED